MRYSSLKPRYYRPAFYVMSLPLVWACLSLSATKAAEAASVQWWQRGQDNWYYKDDWKGKFLTGARVYSKNIEITGQIKAAFVYVWGDRKYKLTVNGQFIGSDVDNGTIEDYDIAEILKPGQNTLEVETGGELAVEGAVVLADGSEIAILSDQSWTGKASDNRRNPRAGYAGNTHMARILTVTAEQKAKALVNKVHSMRRRSADRDTYLFWKERDPREVLTLGKLTAERQLWAKIESLLTKAEQQVIEPTRLIKAGKFAQAIKLAQEAVETAKKADVVIRSVMEALKANNTRRAERLGKDISGHVSFNGSKFNRLGWVASTEPLDNDPVYWEFDIAPAGVGTIGLAGYWRFKLDPENEGVEAGWDEPEHRDADWPRLYAPTKWGWERFGYTQPNGKGFDRHTKPYNGVAWYRKTIIIPAHWKGRDIVLNRGTLIDWYQVWHTDKYWLAINGKFIHPPNGNSWGNAPVTIPAEMINFGRLNTLTIRVVNNNNIGGIINPGLRISAADAQVEGGHRTVCGPAIVREQKFKTPEGQATQVMFCSALSPGVVIATSAKTIRLAGWVARGYANPKYIACIQNGKYTRIPLERDGKVEAKNLSENWLLAWSDEKGPVITRPTLVVFEQRPGKILFGDDGFGGNDIVFEFAKAGVRIGMVRPFDEPLAAKLSTNQLERCRLWSKAMLQYPTGYLEQLRFDGDICRIDMYYEYLRLKDDWVDEPVKLAPLPMLFSYALEYKWPKASCAGQLMDFGNRADGGFYPNADTGTYKALTGTSKISYSFDRRELQIIYKGVGPWGEKWQLGEKLFANVARWGFNSTRPQIVYHSRNLGLIESEGKGWGDNSKINFSEKGLKWLNDDIEWHRKYGLTYIMNWFWDSGRDGIDAGKEKIIIDFWRRMAEHCKDLPENLVVYDLMNEPAGIEWKTYHRLMKQVTEAIRKADKLHWITVEAGNGWAQPEDFDMTESTGDEKTIYQFHFYGPHTGDCHRNDLWYPRYNRAEDRFRSYEAMEEQILPPIRFGIRNHARLFHGELGTSFLGPGKATKLWLIDVLNLHEKYRIGWNWWNYHGNSINRTGLLADKRENPLLAILRKYAGKKPAK